MGGSFRHICIMDRNKRILIQYIIYFDCVFPVGVKAHRDSHVDNKNADVLIFFLVSLFITSRVSRMAVGTESSFYLSTLCLHSRRSSDYGEGICNTYFIIMLSCEWEYFMGLLNAFATFKISLSHRGIDGKYKQKYPV